MYQRLVGLSEQMGPGSPERPPRDTIGIGFPADSGMSKSGSPPMRRVREIRIDPA